VKRPPGPLPSRGALPSFFFLMEGFSEGLRNRFLLPSLVEAISVDLFLVVNVGLYNCEELIIGFWTVKANNLLDVCAFAKTSDD